MKMELIRVAYTAWGTFGVLLEVAPVGSGQWPAVGNNRTPNTGHQALKEPFAVTLERAWRENRPSVGDVPGSCIPEGGYRCVRCRRSPDYGYRAAGEAGATEVLGTDSPKFGDTFQVYAVPGRTTILFHKGNLDDDTRGCILVGEQFERIHGRPGIAASAAGFAEFLRRTAAVEEFALEIRRA